MFTLHLSTLATLAALGQCDPKSFKVSRTRKFVHHGEPFTQGLEFFETGKLIETTGAFPKGTRSSIRVLDLATGEVIRNTDEGMHDRFAEGIARSGDGWLVSTYENKKAVKYNSELLSLSEVDYLWEGWGLSRSSDGSKYFATNGSIHVMELHPETLELEQVKMARCLGKAVPNLNELEMVNDFKGLGPTLLANVYRTRLILGLDPATMQCNSVFHLDDVGEAVSHDEGLGFHVANGIAYLPDSGNLVVTGKNWKKMFEISLVEDGNGSEAHVKLQEWLTSEGHAILLESGQEALSQVPGENFSSHGRERLHLRTGRTQGHLQHGV